MAIDRKKFFDEIRENLFEGVLTQRQVDGMNAVMDTWEQYHFDKDITLARVLHGDCAPRNGLRVGRHRGVRQGLGPTVRRTHWSLR